MSRYRCPRCKLPNSIDSNRVYDGRLMFVCSGCSICALVPAMINRDEAYLEFLYMYDSGHITEIESLKFLMEQEKVLRSTSEINSMILRNNANDNEMLKGILYSQKDYVVDYRVIQEPGPELGNKVQHLPVDDAVIDALMEIQIKKLYKFQEESVKTILHGKDVVVVAPTASGKTEAFCVPILQKIFEEL